MSKKGRFTYAAEALTADPLPTASIKEKSQLEEQEVLAVINEPEENSVLPLPGGLATDALRNPEAYALPRQQRGRRAFADTSSEPRRTDVPREQLNVRIRPELKRAAAGLAGLQGMTLGDVVEAALIEYLKAARR